MTEIVYLISDASGIPADTAWLTRNEKARLDALRFEKRRRDWLLGRWTAKQAALQVAGLQQDDARRIEIATAEDGAPQPFLDGRPFRASLSISHSNGRALCAIGAPGTQIGCDIERIETRGPEFEDTFFTMTERDRIAAAHRDDRDALVTATWCAKESVLKALRTGLRRDTYDVEVTAHADQGINRWNRIVAATVDAGAFDGWWRADNDSVVCIVGRDLHDTPVAIERSALAA